MDAQVAALSRPGRVAGGARGHPGPRRVLARAGSTAWVRDDLRIAAYLDQRFATAGAAGEAEVAEYAAAHADELRRPAPTIASGWRASACRPSGGAS